MHQPRAHPAAVPVAASRDSSTPCQSGVTQASGCIHTGSWSIGKKVPENSISGVTTNRNRMLKPLSFSSRRGQGEGGHGEGQPGEHGDRHRQQHPPRGEGAERAPRRRTKITAPVKRWKATDGEVAAEHLDDPQRRGEHRGVHLVPLDVAHDRVRRLTERRHHRLHREDAGHDVLQVGHPVDPAGAVVDQRAQAQAHRQQEEQRRQEPADDRAAPGAAVDRGSGAPSPTPSRSVDGGRRRRRRSPRRPLGRARGDAGRASWCVISRPGCGR